MSSSRFATIHGGLLARKGEAVPAVRHPEHQVAYGYNSPAGLPASGHAPMHDGQAADLFAPAPIPDLAWRLATDETGAVTASRPAARTEDVPVDAAGKAAAEGCSAQKKVASRRMPRARMSVRLSDRQRRLVRIATAVLGRSQQALLSDALDGHLEKLAATELRSCTCFARQAGDDRSVRRVPPSLPQ